MGDVKCSDWVLPEAEVVIGADDDDLAACVDDIIKVAASNIRLREHIWRDIMVDWLFYEDGWLISFSRVLSKKGSKGIHLVDSTRQLILVRTTLTH